MDKLKDTIMKRIKIVSAGHPRQTSIVDASTGENLSAMLHVKSIEWSIDADAGEFAQAKVVLSMPMMDAQAEARYFFYDPRIGAKRELHAVEFADCDRVVFQPGREIRTDPLWKNAPNLLSAVKRYKEAVRESMSHPRDPVASGRLAIIGDTLKKAIAACEGEE